MPAILLTKTFVIFKSSAFVFLISSLQPHYILALLICQVLVKNILVYAIIHW